MVKKVLSLLFCLIIFSQVRATSYTLTTSNNWTVTTSWSPTAPAGGPTAADNVYIPTALTCTVNSTKACTNLTITGSLYFSAAVTLTVSNNLVLNNGGSIDGSATGVMNVTGTLTDDNTGGSETIGRLTITVNGTTTLGNSLTVSSTSGTPTLKGRVTLNSTGSIYFTAAQTIIMSADLLMNPGSFIDGSAVGIITVATTYTAAAGGTETIGGVKITVTGASVINGTLLFSTTAGTPIFTGDVTVAAVGKINFSAAQTVSMGGNLNATAGCAIGSGGAVGVIKVTGNFNALTGGTTTLGGLTLTITGNLSIAGTAVLDASATSNAINISGNWTNSSSAAHPFVPGTSTVTFNGSAGTQVISITLATGETFYNLIVTNTSTTTPGISTNKNINVSQVYSQTGSCSLDLNGQQLLVTSINNTGFVTCTLSSGKIISSASGASVSFTDANDSTIVLFSGTNVGSSSMAVPLTINVGRMCLASLELYGVGNFTKSLDYGNTSCGGGNKYHNKVTFTSPTSGGHWRMGNNAAPPDTFLAVSKFNANANGVSGNNNFILGAGSSGNYYADSVYLTSTTIGGLFIGRSNDNKTNSHTFNGPVVTNVTLTGNVTFGESNATYSDSVTFKSTLQLNSSNTSTGDIYVGNGQYSKINFTTTGQLIDGTIAGATNVYFYNVTQLGTLPQNTTNTAASNSTIYLGSATAANTWNGSATFTAPNINMANSTYNGTTNIFTANGTSNQTSVGGNTFASSTTSTFNNNGTGYWELANTTADNYNGDVKYFRGAGAGKLSPAYSTSCNYGGNITILAASDSIDFASGGGGVVLIGTTSSTFTNSGSKGTSMKSITLNKTGGANFTLASSVGVPANGSLQLTSGLLNTSATAYLYLMDETVSVLPGALSAASTSYINGPMRYDMSVSGSTKNLIFPIGVGSDCRPVTLTVQHSSATSFSYMGQVFSANPWTTFGSTATDMPSTCDTISGVHYWEIDRSITSSGVSASSSSLSVSAGSYPLITLGFGTNDGVYQGSNVTVVKNTSAATHTWIDIGGSSALGNFSSGQVGSVSSTSSPSAFNSFSAFTLGSKKTGWDPLPISLLDFSAIPDGNKVDIKWETVTETNNAYFTLEKSKDGNTFTKLIDVPGAGNSTSQIDYFETDYQPYSGTSYYRLKQTDFNGNYKYFNVVPVTFTEKNLSNITAYPNPINAGEAVDVHITGYKGQEVTVALIDAQGREFLTKVIMVEDDTQKITLYETQSLPAGTYIVTASSNDKIYNSKIIVK